MSASRSRRAGPPGLLVLVVLLVAAVGGAKLAVLVSQQDVANLSRPLETETPAATPSASTVPTP